MSNYVMTLRSDRATFSIGLDAEDDDAAIEKAIGLIVKAKAPVGAVVTIIRPDQSCLNVSEAVMPYLDRPEF